MSEKRPVDKKRESGGTAEIGSGDDGDIIQMCKVGERTIIVKEKSLYELILADQIDPKRENPDLPNNMQQLVLNRGTDSEMVCKTFLTAYGLLTSSFLHPSVNGEKGLILSLEVLKELVALDEEIMEYMQMEAKAIKEYQDRIGKSLSYAIPSIPTVKGICKTVFEKADHVVLILMDIIKLFHSDEELTSPFNFKELYEVSKNKYGETDEFTLYVKKVEPILELIRSFRNCFLHRRPNVKVMDFEKQVTSEVCTPTIEIDYRSSKHERVAISSLLPSLITELPKIIEGMIAFLCSKNMISKGVFQCKVLFIPENERRNKFIKYGTWLQTGQGGFYLQ
jgi:hypothetical protein